MNWNFKFAICVLVDLFDLTIGRVLFVIPYASEIIGASIACALFGPKGLIYLSEVIDPTEQLDGFIPTATIIALLCKEEHQTT